jgi:tRNA 5-methylaminomethyl-2-thiouridine biosynthesis bifunctional protein
MECFEYIFNLDSISHELQAVSRGNNMAVDAQLAWMDDGAPYSRRFGDRYFSAHDGRAEAREVFLGGNGLPGRWRVMARGEEGEGGGAKERGCAFTIAELGFGTGLNFMETLRLWREYGPAGARLRYAGFEIAPLGREQILRALLPWPDLRELAADILPEPFPPRPGERLLSLPGVDVELELIVGDARETLARWEGVADAFYLDGFAPACNPQMWEEGLMAEVFAHMKPGASFSTYSAAGFARRNLLAAGFEVRRVRGFGRKRERLEGEKPCSYQHA